MTSAMTDYIHVSDSGEVSFIPGEMTDNRTTELDSCKVVRLDGVEVQENGIIRDARGWIIGRADTEWMRYQWRMIVSGVCPCCGRMVDGDGDE